MTSKCSTWGKLMIKGRHRSYGAYFLRARIAIATIAVSCCDLLGNEQATRTSLSNLSCYNILNKEYWDRDNDVKSFLANSVYF